MAENINNIEMMIKNIVLSNDSPSIAGERIIRFLNLVLSCDMPSFPDKQEKINFVAKMISKYSSSEEYLEIISRKDNQTAWVQTASTRWNFQMECPRTTTAVLLITLYSEFNEKIGPCLDEFLNIGRKIESSDEAIAILKLELIESS